MKPIVRIAVSAAVALLCAAVPVRAQYVTTLGDANSSCRSNGIVYPGIFCDLWQPGDYWLQTGLNGGGTLVDHLSLDLYLTSDFAIFDYFIADVDVTLNGTEVGSLVLYDGLLGRNDFSFDFAPMSSPSYDLQMTTSGDCFCSRGYVGLDPLYWDQNTATLSGPLTVTPEPATLVLLGTGLLGVGGVVRRRRRPA